MDKYEEHIEARKAIDKTRIRQAKKWLNIVNKLYDGSIESENELKRAKSKLQRAYDESDFYHENEDEISQIKDVQQCSGKNTI